MMIAKLPECLICKKELTKEEGCFCFTCLAFIRYKYKTLDNFVKIYVEEMTHNERKNRK